MKYPHFVPTGLENIVDIACYPRCVPTGLGKSGYCDLLPIFRPYGASHCYSSQGFEPKINQANSKSLGHIIIRQSNKDNSKNTYSLLSSNSAKKSSAFCSWISPFRCLSTSSKAALMFSNSDSGHSFSTISSIFTFIPPNKKSRRSSSLYRRPCCILKKNLGIKSPRIHPRSLVISGVRPGLLPKCCLRVNFFLRLHEINVLVDLFAKADLNAPVLVALIDGIVTRRKSTRVTQDVRLQYNA